MKEGIAMTLLKLEFKNIFRGLLFWMGILIVVLVVFMAFFPAMESSTIQNLVRMKLGALPAPLLAAFGLTEMSDFSDIKVYFAFIMQFINIAIAIYAARAGTSALIKEETDGTIEYLYAQPITRSGIVAAKMVAHFLTYCLLIIILEMVSMILVLVFSSGKYEVIVLLLNVKGIYLGTFISGFIFMILGLWFSVKLRSTRQIGLAAMWMVFGTYSIGIFAALVDAVGFLRYLSPLDLFEPNLILASGINLKALGLWGGVVILAIGMTFAFYNKKDLKV
ncbi:ABC transporter permease subunit [Acetobacterium paludosum]|uniref:ABC transporter permease subunit n=2 Tax=Acetobacterium paludosum TaxID=52693 RepID=A0A923KWV8_9FIRM|nr:ABC transporter permease subunit [Acetobacterium paludosum]